MIGQTRLLEKIATYNINTFPKTILLLGETGCGKKTLVGIIAEQLDLEVVTISNTISVDELISYQQSPINKIYLIDLDNFTQKQQNQFLKFIEEPSKTNYIILISSYEAQVLETIKNRCIKFNFQNYSINELKQFKYFDNNEIYEVCNTPGQLKDIDPNAFIKLTDLCETIIKKITVATFANTVSITTKINYKEDYDKYDFELFLKVLLNRLKIHYINSSDKKYLDEYLFILSYVKVAQIKTLNKENFITNLLINYKKYLDKLI